MWDRLLGRQSGAHWYQDIKRFNREIEALRSLNLTHEVEVDEEERLCVKDEPFEGLALELIYPASFPSEPPKVFIKSCDFPVALLKLIQLAGYVTEDLEVRHMRLHRWSSRYTGAAALSWARDILVVATRLLPDTELPPLGPPATAAGSTQASNAPADEDGSEPEPSAPEGAAPALEDITNGDHHVAQAGGAAASGVR